MKNLSHFLAVNKIWLLAFTVVMLIHTAVIASMIIKDEMITSVIAAPPSSVVMLYANVSTQIQQKQRETPQIEKVAEVAPEVIVDVQADNGIHRKLEKSKSSENREVIKEKVAPKNDNELKTVETVKKDNKVNDNIPELNNQQDINQQVALHSDIKTDLGAMAKNQDELAMAQWQHKVQAHLERLKRYPILALKQKKQGIVKVYFTINKEGEILSSKLSRTSGISMLDRATIQLIARATPLPIPSKHLSSQKISIEVPIRYFIQ